MRRRRLKKLWQRLHQVRGMNRLTRDDLLLKLGAAKQDAGKAWTQKTAWGEPDISGAWTSDDMRGVPRERAAEYGTRRLLSDEEFAKRLAADTQGRDREANRSGGFRNDTGTRTFRQTSLVLVA